MMSIHSLLIVVLLGVALAAHAAPRVVHGTEQRGDQAHLGNPNERFLVLGPQGFTTRVEATPGRVRVRAWLRFNNRGEAFRQTPYILTVNDVSSSQTVDAFASGAPCTVEMLNRAPGLTISIRQGGLLPEADAELRRLRVAHDQQTLDPEAGLGTDLVKEPSLEEDPDAAKRPLPTVLLDRIEIEHISGPLIVVGIRSDRITYAPGATAKATVIIENISQDEHTGVLTVECTEGLTHRIRLEHGPITLRGNATVEKSFTLPVGQALWGRGIEANIAMPQGTDRGAHAFSVMTHPWQVALHGRGTPMFGSQRWTDTAATEQAHAIARANMASYCNIYEAFAWAPCDYSEMTPDDDEPIYSGQTQYTKKRSALQTLHRVFKEYGIASITYGKSCASGLPGMAYALRHPDQMHVFNTAGFAHEAISVDMIDRMLEGHYRQHGRDEDFWQYWISAWTAIGNMDAANAGVDEIAASAKLLGWDGVRYDGHFNAWRNPAMSARVVKHAADRLRQQIPGFAIGYNVIGPQHNTPHGAFRDAELAACAHGGGLIMSEYYRGLLGPVRTNIEHLRWGGDATRLHGGYWLAIIDEPSDWNQALVLASGARPMGGNTRYHKFATRFSSVIFDPAMRRLQDPAKVIRPEGDPGFLWDAFIYEKDVSEDTAALILQLVNVSERFTFHGAYRPPTGVNAPREQVIFTLNLPAGYTAEHVFACDDDRTFVPMNATLQGNRLIVPRVSTWTLVVVTLKKATPATDLFTRCQIPIAVDGTPAMTLEESRAALQIGPALGPDAATAVQEAKVLITPELLAKIFAQGPPVCAGPGESVYHAADFTAHTAGVDRGLPGKGGATITVHRDGIPDIHYARGIFSHLDRLPEAFARVKGARVTSSSLDNGGGACGATLRAENIACLTDYPTPETLCNIDILVLNEVPATGLTWAQRKELLSFVENGGALLVLGGWYALSKGAYEGSFLEEALPVRVKQSTYLRRLRGADQRLTATPEFAAVLGGTAPSFGTKGAVEWTSHLQPKPGAKVLMTAGGTPLLIIGTHGTGRVAVWAGSHSGQPETPYWRHAAWPQLMGQVLKYLAAGAEVVSPPRVDEELEQCRRILREPTKHAPHKPFPAVLHTVLQGGTDEDAILVAEYLLEQRRGIPLADYDALTNALLPYVSAAPGWAYLATQYRDDPPPMLERLVAEIVAVAGKGVTAADVLKWGDIGDLTRVRCLAATRDAAALPFLRRLTTRLDDQEARWTELIARNAHSTDNVKDVYSTHLLRPFVAYARMQCSERTEETVAQFCQGALALPYYAWRQRWVLGNAYSALGEANQQGNPDGVANARARIAAQQAIIRQLDAAEQHMRKLFRPDVVGMDALGRRAVARALAETDCHKAIPMALAFLDACSPADLQAFNALNEATLESIRFFYQSKVR